MGIALLLPRASTTDDRKAVYRALAAWEGACRTGEEDTPLLPIHLGAAGSLQVRRLEEVPLQRTLQIATWVGPARSWATVTPIALDNHPGDLHANDPAKLNRVIAEASSSIAAACANIGLPRPEAVEILPAAPVAGSPKARHYPPFPNDPNRTRRALTHARIIFERPVRGPVILGAGRFVGLGLLRPEVADV
ncbi:MAG: type I-U CRISPR-associated protein Cas5/Cas6 [Candidatus Eisenbacteria bacterium]|nr:type I-U CRISPR-associated protein Cas5/Cas6 [Candidatus Eisenbacteria bacterium]